MRICCVMSRLLPLASCCEAGFTRVVVILDFQFSVASNFVKGFVCCASTAAFHKLIREFAL